MAKFNKEDYDKIKDMEYDTGRKCFVGKDGSELDINPYGNGTGYKIDYYDKSPYGNAKHNSTHIKASINEDWERTDNDRDNGTQNKSSGSGCYLTSACIQHLQQNFDDKCYELSVLRWFRDKFVTKEDIEHYYEVAPVIVENINEDKNANAIYNYIYDNIVSYCVEQIKQGNYEAAYDRYKSSVIVLEEKFAKPRLMNRLTRVLKTQLNY